MRQYQNNNFLETMRYLSQSEKILKEKIEQYEALSICPVCHTISIDNQDFCDCGDKTEPMKNWMRQYRKNMLTKRDI